jgi:hypothetical protein
MSSSYNTSIEYVLSRSYTIRGLRVMIDEDLAASMACQPNVLMSRSNGILHDSLETFCSNLRLTSIFL